MWQLPCVDDGEEDVMVALVIGLVIGVVWTAVCGRPRPVRRWYDEDGRLL